MPPKQSRIDILALATLVVGATLTQLGTVLNNAYSGGSTLFDSAEEISIMWRSGWVLTPARVIDVHSYFENHFSPFLYIPQLISYVAPIDRMTFAGLVYGVVYSALLALTYRILRRLSVPSWAAFVGAVAVYLSGPVLDANWEPHHESMSGVLMIAFFLAWVDGQKAMALVLLLANAAVREDCGILLSLPLACLWLLELIERRNPISDIAAPLSAAPFALLSLASGICAFVAKSFVPSTFDTIDYFYYTKAAPFAHLSAALIEGRVEYLFTRTPYMVWPALALIAGSIVLRSWRPMIGWIAFLPYFIFDFFSKMDLAAHFESYKAFPYFLTLLWPSLMALGPMRQEKKRLLWLQAIVLCCGVFCVRDGSLGIRYSSSDLEGRWLLRPETANSADYRNLAPRLAMALPTMGVTIGSAAAIALYPDLFDVWSRSWVGTADGPKVDADGILWFIGDVDMDASLRWLDHHPGMHHYRVIGTKLVLSTRRNERDFALLMPMLQGRDITTVRY